MRSNIARTESAGSVPVPAPIAALSAGRLDAAAALTLDAALDRGALQRGQEVDERRLLVLREGAEGGHRGSRVLERAPDGALLELVADVGQVRAGPSLPFSPILWHARHPDWAATSLPFSRFGATCMSIEFGEPAAAPM